MKLLYSTPDQTKNYWKVCKYLDRNEERKNEILRTLHKKNETANDSKQYPEILQENRKHVPGISEEDIGIANVFRAKTAKVKDQREGAKKGIPRRRKNKNEPENQGVYWRRRKQQTAPYNSRKETYLKVI